MKSTRLKEKPHPFRVRAGTGFIAFISIIFFFDEQGLLAALLPAVAVHELAHMAALFAMGAPPHTLNATLAGFSMDYTGELDFWGEILSALAGPAAGLALAGVCAFWGSRLESEYLLLSAGIGLILNLFNLLPAPRLDGGRAIAPLIRHFFGERVEKRVLLASGGLIAFSLIICGVFFFAQGMGFAMIPAGLWILVGTYTWGM